MHIPNDWVLLATVLSPLIAVGIFIFTERRSAQRAKSEQLLIAVEYIYKAWNELNSDILIMVRAVQMSESQINYLQKVASRKDRSAHKEMFPLYELTMADKILHVYKESHLSRALLYLYQMKTSTQEVFSMLLDTTDQMTWKEKQVKAYDLSVEFSDYSTILDCIVKSKISKT